MVAIAWMSSYFERVGDKRPDKNGIYLPTCLTETMIYSLMVKGLSNDTICFSQFNKLFRNQFSYVTIPKVYVLLQILQTCMMIIIEVH